MFECLRVTDMKISTNLWFLPNLIQQVVHTLQVLIYSVLHLIQITTTITQPEKKSTRLINSLIKDSAYTRSLEAQLPSLGPIWHQH